MELSQPNNSEKDDKESLSSGEISSPQEQNGVDNTEIIVETENNIDSKRNYAINSPSTRRKSSSGFLDKIRGLTNGQPNSNNVPFWKQKKVPGTIKQVQQLEKIPRVIGATYPPPRDESDVAVVFNKRSSKDMQKELSPNKTLPHSSSYDSLSSDERSNLESPPKSLATPQQSPKESISILKLKKFQKLLDEPNVDLDALRKLGWQGIPDSVRAMSWRLLMGYLPTNKERRSTIMERKKKDYMECVPKYFDVSNEQRSPEERALFRQIQIDVPRTNPHIPLFQSSIVQQCLARVLYIWAIRHPASGYVQGINDLATPFFVIFLSDSIGEDSLQCDVNQVPESVLQSVEADTYWCMTKLLDGIQDNYTFSQPGIQRMIHKLSELIHRIDAPLHEHLNRQEAHFIQFSFRWMNCLLMRELPLHLLIRVWDSYLSELENFSVFHIYVCAAFLAKFSKELKTLEFQDIMLFLKEPPTENWETKDIELILSQAFMWMKLFDDSPKHLAKE